MYFKLFFRRYIHVQPKQFMPPSEAHPTPNSYHFAPLQAFYYLLIKYLCFFEDVLFTLSLFMLVHINTLTFVLYSM